MLDKQLHILKASAGSGKTYSLVQHYLSVILKSTDFNLFTRIMAMTFTNKATLEMKDRVIADLVRLAHGTDEKSKKLLENTVKKVEMDPLLIQERAKNILRHILHNYGELSIMTIDKFNLRLIRTFTRDLDLPADFEIIIDADELMEKIVDQLIESIGKEDKKQLTQLLMEFSKFNADSDKSWNFRSALLDFIKLTQHEKNSAIIDEIATREYSKEKLNEIQAEKAIIENNITKQAKELYDELIRNNWVRTDFQPKLMDVFTRINDSQKGKSIDVKELTPTMEASMEQELINPRTKVSTEYVKKSIVFFDLLKSIKERHLVLQNVLQSFYQIALIKNINELLNDARKNENIIRIEEFNKLISHLIQSESAPYIYERIGTRFDHYLLDEFQDTSRLQWQNLTPLVHESLSSGNSNLIVGDAKQAIYRFRNGLVEQFAALPKIYNPENIPSIERVSAYFEEAGETKTLGENYRSKKEVVEFNNQLFSVVSKHLSPAYQEYYEAKDLFQTPKTEGNGFVCIEQVEDNEVFVKSIIDECLEDGFAPGEICILTNKNEECVYWANFLIEKGHKVISSIALEVQQSKHVNLLVNYLRYRKNPTIHANQLLLIESYFELDEVDGLEKIKSLEAEFGKKDVIKAFANNHFESFEAFYGAYENLYDLGQKLLRLFHIEESSNPYIHHFCDMLQAFDLVNGPDLTEFLKYYDRKGRKESVVLASTPDAIQILTVHKSKGLEFPVVIMPSINWRLGFSNNQPKQLFFDSNHNEIYLAGSSVKEGTDYQVAENNKELEAIKLDKINQFYVACTRAVDRLYFALGDKPTNGRLEKIVVDELKSLTLLSEEKEGRWIYGTRTQHIYIGEKSNSFIPKSLGDRLWFPDISLIDQDGLEKEELQVERRFGTQFHLLFSELTEPKTAHQKLTELIGEHKIEAQFQDKISQSIAEIIDNKLISDLIFPQENEEILNERELVVAKGTKIRPDRVILSKENARVIDFKTGIPKKRDHNQVKDYVHALQSLGYENCEGFLLYTDTLKSERVI